MHGTARALIGLAAVGTIGAVPAAWAGSAPSTASISGAKAKVSATARPKGLSYVAPAGEGAVSIVVSRDRRQVRGVIFAYRAPCTDGTHIRDFDVYNAIPLSTHRRFKSSYDSGPQMVMPGTTAQASGSISGALNKAGTKITGIVQFTGTLTSAATTYKCDTGPVSFTATD